MFCATGQNVQWSFMHGLMENAIYGGRVDNTFDMRVLSAYLRQYFDSGLLSDSRSRGKRLTSNVTLPNSTNIKVPGCGQTDNPSRKFEKHAYCYAQQQVTIVSPPPPKISAGGGPERYCLCFLKRAIGLLDELKTRLSKTLDRGWRSDSYS